MEFIDYIKPIQSYYNYKNQHDVVIDLFQACGTQREVPSETAKSWLKKGAGHRNCTIKDYFPEKKLNEAGFIGFFKNRGNSNWKELQTYFASINDDNVIDLNTNIENDFYWSLLNQFQKIHNLPLSEKPLVSGDASICNVMIEIFKDSVEYYRITDFISWNPALFEFTKIIIEYDLHQLAADFVDDIEDNILREFCSHKNELVFIQISRFVHLIKKYLDYISATHFDIINRPPSVNLCNLETIMNLKSESKDLTSNTTRFQSQLKNIYEDICNMYIH